LILGGIKMDNNAELKFKEVRKGYDKDDVINYIESINKKFISIEDDYKKTITAQNNEIIKLTSLINTAPPEASIDELKRIEEKNTECNNVINALNETIEKLNNEKTELNSELIRLKSESTDIVNKEDLKHKADLYDKMSSQIGSMLIFANEKVDEFLENASEQADEIIGNANKQAADIVSNANKQATDIVAEANSGIEELKNNAKVNINKLIKKNTTNLSKSIDDYVNDFIAFDSEVKTQLNEFLQSVREKSDKILINIFNDKDLNAKILNEIGLINEENIDAGRQN